MHPHDPEPVEAQAGGFQNAQNLDRRRLGLRLKLPGRSQASQPANGRAQRDAPGDTIKPGQFGEQFLPDFKCLVLRAVDTAISGPPDRLQESGQDGSPVARHPRGLQCLVVLGPGQEPGGELGTPMRGIATARQRDDVRQRNHWLSQRMQGDVQESAAGQFLLGTLQKRGSQESAGDLDWNLPGVGSKEEECRLDNRVLASG